MSHADYLEAWGRERGCWGVVAAGRSRCAPFMFWPDRVLVGIGIEAQAYPLPLAVLVLLTHLVDAGERLTLGRCPACVERGGRWEWALGNWSDREASGIDGADFLSGQGWVWVDGAWAGAGGRVLKPIARACPACSEPGEPVECEACDGSGKVRVAIVASRSNIYAFGVGTELTDLGDVECSGCKGTGSQPGPGVPTGLRRVSAAEALLLARPGPWSSRSIEAVHGEPDKDTASLLQATMDKWTDAGHEVERLTNHVFSERKPGDPDARAALHEYADRRMNDGDPLGRWLALWLSGAPCEGRPPWACEAGSIGGGIDCEACHGDGTALGQQLDAMIPETRLRDDGVDALAYAAEALAQAPTLNSP